MDAQPSEEEEDLDLVKLCKSDSLSLDLLRRATLPFVATSREDPHQQLKKAKKLNGKKKGHKKKKKRSGGGGGGGITNWNFIHEVCGNKLVTLEIVQHLLEVFPDAASKFCTNRLRIIRDYIADPDDASEKQGCAYPLHIACFNNDCPSSVIELLVGKNAEALRHRCNFGLPSPDDPSETAWYDGGLPLHCYLSRMSRDIKEDKVVWGQNKSNIDLAVVEMLVNAYQNALMATNDAKQTPLHIILQNEHTNAFPLDIVRFFTASAENRPPSLPLIGMAELHCTAPVVTNMSHLRQ